MDLRVRKLAIDAAEWDVLIGWGTGVAIVVLRSLALLGVLSSESPTDWVVFAEVAVQLVLAAVFTYGVYRRHRWAAIGLLVIWGVGYFYSWYMLGRVLPPLGLIGLLIWYGLYRGLRGASFLARQQAAAAGAV